MPSLTPGQRLKIGNAGDCRIRFEGKHTDRIGVAAIGSQGKVVPFDAQGQGAWHCDNLDHLGDQAEIVAYMLDDRHGGFVNESYPLHITLQGEAHQFPAPDQPLAAVILAEIYVKDGSRRLKVSNDGFAFGIDAYARARNLGGIEVPFRTRPSPDNSWQHGPDNRDLPRTPGQMLGTGSGVIIGPDLVITNAHVIEGGQNFHVGRSRDALAPIAVDPLHDLALLQGKTPGTMLPIRLGAPVWLGESVMAAGFPLMDVLGSDLKVTTGNISGLTGSLSDVSRFQFTAPIGSGSSGGAIVDEYGNLVGIVAAALAHREFRERGSISENVNFAIKAALVFELVASAGISLPNLPSLTDSNRRDVVNRLRSSVISISVTA